MPGVHTYCREARALGGASPTLKHFRRLSDNLYTIHSKVRALHPSARIS